MDLHHLVSSHEAVHNALNLKVFRELVESESHDPNVSDSNGESLFYLVCVHGKPEFADVLMANPRVNINIKTSLGITPLMLIAGGEPPNKGRMAIMQKLLARPDLEINATDNEGNTAFMWAAMSYSIEPFRLLVQNHSVDVNHENIALYKILYRRMYYVGNQWGAPMLTMVELLFTRPEFRIVDIKRALGYQRDYENTSIFWRREVESTEVIYDKKTFDLIKRFHSDPLGTSIEMKAKHGMLPHVELFCVMEFKSPDVQHITNPGLALFKRVFDRLPTELKMRMCSLAHGANIDYITQKEIDCVMLQGKV